MKLLQFLAAEGSAQPGVLSNERVLSLVSLGYPDLRAILEAGPGAFQRVQQLVSSAPEGSGLALADVRLLAPLPNAGKLIFIGLNYRDHAAEARMEIPPT
ncbi:MAG: 5-oxopent-3-ene-1,2,5-tricarboxylate decarboxylase, partial [Bryobacterales bacterium]|nr:5-oxopent-3-ene-1,2,5-tricarboxylate decarboxylase [Bryobacterales bacterium]